MKQRRGHGGFRQVGRIPAGRLGLPANRSRELRLAQAWRNVAGESLARGARARRVLRGVLEVEVDDRAWYDAVAELLPLLARRLADRYGELGVRRYRLCLTDQADLPEALPIAAPGAAEDPGAARDPAAPPRTPRPRNAPTSTAAGATKAGDAGGATDEERLLRVARRYLERTDADGPRKT